jgi:hypothetical protein
MSFNRSSAFPQIPQNASARETARRLIGLPVPPKFDIAHLRPEHLPPGERFETPADGRARRDAEQERLERSLELTEVADRLLQRRVSLRRSDLSNLRTALPALAYRPSAPPSKHS